jgi:hypothetical protein
VPQERSRLFVHATGRHIHCSATVLQSSITMPRALYIHDCGDSGEGEGEAQGGEGWLLLAFMSTFLRLVAIMRKPERAQNIRPARCFSVCHASCRIVLHYGKCLLLSNQSGQGQAPLIESDKHCLQSKTRTSKCITHRPTIFSAPRTPRPKPRPPSSIIPRPTPHSSQVRRFFLLLFHLRPLYVLDIPMLSPLRITSTNSTAPLRHRPPAPVLPLFPPLRLQPQDEGKVGPTPKQAPV